MRVPYFKALFKLKSKREGKVHILIFSSNLSRGIHLQPLTDLVVKGFLRSIKPAITRKGYIPFNSIHQE